MPLLFRPPRLHHWFDQIRCLAEMQLAQVHVHVITSTFELDQKRQIANLLRPFQSPAFSAEIESFWDPDDPKAMTWQHKKLFDSAFLGNGRFTHFVYLEDDLRFTWNNLTYWLRYRDVLKPYGFIPSFVRYEYNMTDHDLYASDCVEPTRVGQSALLVDGEIFVMPHNPYCAMYVMDHELGEEYRRSRSFDPETSQTVSGWPSTKRSAMGLCFDPIPPGRQSRFLVPFDIGRRLPHLGALVHHLPNNFANRQFPIEGYQHGALKLMDAFV